MISKKMIVVLVVITMILIVKTVFKVLVLQKDVYDHQQWLPEGTHPGMASRACNGMVLGRNYELGLWVVNFVCMW